MAAWGQDKTAFAFVDKVFSNTVIFHIEKCTENYPSEVWGPELSSGSRAETMLRTGCCSSFFSRDKNLELENSSRLEIGPPRGWGFKARSFCLLTFCRLTYEWSGGLRPCSAHKANGSRLLTLSSSATPARPGNARVILVGLEDICLFWHDL